MTALFSKQPPAKPELWLYWMRSHDFIGNSIAMLTDGLWSHAGVLVYNPDGTAYVYEALFAEGKIVKQDARQRLATFCANIENQLCVVPVVAEDYQVAAALRYAESCVGDVTYGRMQLLAMLAAQRYGAPMARSPKKQVCSEFQARCVGGGDDETAPCIIMDLRDDRHRPYDFVTPGSGFRRMMTLLAGYGDYTQHPPRTFSPIFDY
jgi:hypothetical protein